MAKTVNYTPEMTLEVVTAYVAASTAEARDEIVNSFADKFGKTVASIRMKLTREEVYIKKTPTTKTGETVQRKAKMVDSITPFTGYNEAEATSAEKMNKSALSKTFSSFMALTKTVQDQDKMIREQAERIAELEAK